MKLFRNTESIFEEIGKMEKDEQARQEDRTTVSAFFNGQPPLPQAEADAMGLSVNVNNLFGYTDLASAKEQTLSLYTKPPRLFNISLDWARPGKKQEWEMAASTAFNRIIKRSGRLKNPYNGVAGDAVMHGEGEFFFPNPRTPYPRHLPLSRRLIPSGASSDPRELTHFGIKAPLTIHEIMRHTRRKSEGWNIPRLRQLADALLEKVGKESKASLNLSRVEQMNPEELEYARQGNNPLDRLFRTEIPVVYFYQANPENEGRPLDLNILCKYAINEGKDAEQFQLFEEEEFFPTVTDAIQPYFMDTILGGAPEWHRVKGLGHLNYGCAWHTELLLNRMMQGSMESMMDMWKASDGATREDLERFVAKHNGIVPEGIDLIQNRRSIDFNGILSIFNLYRAAGNRNAMQHGSNSGDNQGQMLEVQALFQQGQITAQQSSRHANWYDYLGFTGQTMLSRFSDYEVMPSDEHYSDIMEFQGEMKRLGIPLRALHAANAHVTAYRITGDGDEMKAQRSAAFFMQNMAMYPAESQQILKRRVTAVMADDYELAEQLVPIEQKPDIEQTRQADGENNTCIIQGRPPQITATDIDEVHIGTHLQGMEALLGDVAEMQQQAFNPKQLKSFKALGAHTIAHVQRMESMGKKDEARRAMEQIQQYARIAEKFQHNMEQMQQAQQEEGAGLDPLDVAKLHLDERKLALAERKTQFGEYMKERQQTAKEHHAGVDTNLKFASDARQEEQHKADISERDARLALDITQATKPQPASAE